MKKLFCLLLGAILLTGCGSKLEKTYDNMKIGDNIESYQLDLRIYGTVDNKRVNEIIKIDNYKNVQYKIDNSEFTYYVANGVTYKTPSRLEEGKEQVYEKVTEDLFYDTDLLLQGLNNIKSKTETENDLNLELEVYNIELKDSYIKDLLTKLGYDSNFTESSGKLYLSDGNLYKIIYNVDSLIIDAGFFRINGIREFNIDFEGTESE